MKEKFLKTTIDNLNKGKTRGLIHLRRLSELVDLGKVWLSVPRKTDKVFTNTNEPYTFYFIKNEAGFYVATVLDMVDDLHWFVDKKYRKQGHLIIALKQNILPHLFQNRDRQRITIDEDIIGHKNALASSSVAIKLGFKNGENIGEFWLSADQVENEEYIYGYNKLIPEERLDQLKKEINYLGRSLSLIHSEVEMNLGESSFTEDLLDLAKQIKKCAVKLEDSWWDCKNNNAD